MAWEIDLRAALQASVAVQHYVPADAINWGAQPDGVAAPVPGIVLQAVGVDVPQSLDGEFSRQTTRVQIDCYAAGYAGAWGAARAVAAVVKTLHTDSIHAVFRITERDTREGGAGDAVRPYRRSIDFDVHHKG